MTIADFRKQSTLYPDDTELLAFNGDEEILMPVTGVLFTPRIDQSTGPTLEFCTDEP